MVKIVKSKLKASRSVGENLHSSIKFDKKPYLPGIHKMARRSTSGYAVQSKERKKLIFFYGISTSFLKSVTRKAISSRKNSIEQLIEKLESLTATVIMRAGFVSGIFAAKQLIQHGHVKLNGKSMNLCKVLLKEGDVLEIVTKNHPDIVKHMAENKAKSVANHLEVDNNKLTVKLKNAPKLYDGLFHFSINFQQIVELYSL